jgi:hypothetical protein
MKKLYKQFILAIAVLLSSSYLRAQSTPTVLVPFSGSNSIACGVNSLLQDHAGNSNYSDNANGFTVINAGFASQITINGTYAQESCCDYIEIYNGSGTGGTLLFTTAGNSSGTINYTGTPGQTLTVYFYSDGSVVFSGFDLNITFAGPCSNIPCSSSPGANSVVAPTSPICPNSSTGLFSAVNYSVGSILYQWYSSTASNVGPFTAIPSATNNFYNTPSLTAQTWYQVVATCTNAPGSTTYAVGAVSVAATTTNSVPYFEGFENSNSLANKLPNCSWNRNTSTIKTGATGNWGPLNGNGFAEYYVGNCSGTVPSNTGYLYSNGIQLFPGITYSANVWYIGYQNTSVALLYGSAQSPGSLTLLNSDNSPGTSTYTPLSGTFQVTSAGIYYMAIRNIDGSGSCSYNSISYDDLSVTIPCLPGINSPNLSLTGPSTICEGQAANLVASGANTYSWNTGANTASISPMPLYIGTYSVTGTNTLTGCSLTAVKQVSVNPLPAISINGTGNSICLGSSIGFGVSGAYSYTWSNGSNAQFVTLTPTATTTYSVLGLGTYGCIGLATQVVTVNPLPAITVLGNRIICLSGGNFTASGANTYTWSSNSYYLQGSAVTITSSQANVCTVSGTDGNNCVGTTTLALTVDPCTGILSHTGNELNKVTVYPNPTNGEFTVELKNGLNKTVELMDVTGRIVLSETTDLDVIQLNINSISNGVYYVKIKSDNTTNTLKIVKQ